MFSVDRPRKKQVTSIARYTAILTAPLLEIIQRSRFEVGPRVLPVLPAGNTPSGSKRQKPDPSRYHLFPRSLSSGRHHHQKHGTTNAHELFYQTKRRFAVQHRAVFFFNQSHQVTRQTMHTSLFQNKGPHCKLTFNPTVPYISGHCWWVWHSGRKSKGVYKGIGICVHQRSSCFRP